MPELESTAVPHEQAELGRALMALHGFIPPFVARIVPGHIRPGQWTRMADLLEAVAEQCRRQDVVLDETDHQEIPGPETETG